MVILKGENLMTKLEEKIKSYADSYYRGEEIVSDAEYDSLLEQLRIENPNSELLNTVVGDELKGVYKKYKLPVTMGTLFKCRNESEFREWFNKKNTNDYYVCEYKLDGNSQLLEYHDGKFIRSYSRGNSEFGEDTTQNVSLVNGVMKEIDLKGTIYIRGEVVLLKDNFKKYFPNDANPRNTAAGIMRHKDGKDCNKLNFIAYDIFSDSEVGVDDYELNKLETLERNEFQIPDYFATKDVDEILKYRTDVTDKRNSLNYDIDGIVIKNNSVDKEDLMRKTPLNNCAIKFDLVSQVTKVKNIRWQLCGRYFSPVVDIKPVELCGTTVSKASVSNVNIMNDLGIYIGADVEISKAGEIIPTVVKVLNPKKNAFSIPTTCPVCGGKVEINQSGFPECINEDCARKVGHRFKRMFKVFGVKGCGDTFIARLEENDISIKYFLDMCKSNDPKILNSFAGGINGEKIYKQMNDVFNREITPAQFLAIFDVKFFDEKKLNQIIGWNLDDMLNVTYNKIINVDGFAEVTAKAFVDFINSYRDEINDLKTYFNISETKEVKEKNMSMPRVCFTGTGPIGRKELSDKASDKGWEVVNSITKDLDTLVCADPNSNSSKMQKARKNNIKIISYEEFIKDLE